MIIIGSVIFNTVPLSKFAVYPILLMHSSDIYVTCQEAASDAATASEYATMHPEASHMVENTQTKKFYYLRKAIAALHYLSHGAHAKMWTNCVWLSLQVTASRQSGVPTAATEQAS
ncbi:hypothetical protein CEXT_76501 [Caerostris extrusa]|uniref:Uncharacterized protein n=1 Tax=Caerostris extrusa TaxID=172846 RepID=A0AAV4WUJ3_CAEEX|nr:hypothetical protein CEXT_76501 [Caerostris extrusa]